MKVKVKIDQVDGVSKVANAWCSGTLFRGFETLLQGRDPWDAPVITERICGVCPVSHATASVKALEDAAGFIPPTNARLLRNLVLGANYIQSHILHFYLLAAPDFVKGPDAAPWAPAWDVDIEPTLTIHLLEAIEARRRAHEMGAIFGGRNPCPHTFIPGGFTAVPNKDRIDKFRDQLTWLISFIRNIYIPDVQALSNVYSGYFEIGKGYRQLLTYGVFDMDDAGTEKLFHGGFVNARRPSNNVGALDINQISESVTYSWYDNETNNLNPDNGFTVPVDPDLKKAGYSWLKAPRYNNLSMEVGPLARMWINGHYREGVSVMDRHLARAYETLKIAEAMMNWLGELTPGAPVYSSYRTPDSGTGIGLVEAPRGALGHWVGISGGKISHYQIVTPTCWNASPRGGANNKKGPMEFALVGTVIANPEKPIEVLRIIHSFDPCLSCAVHVMRPDGKPFVVYKTNP